jgi:hypothetical protein
MDPRVTAFPHPTGQPDTCLGRTCMKWQIDGELTGRDLQLILQRLSLADGRIAAGAGDLGGPGSAGEEDG